MHWSCFSDAEKFVIKDTADRLAERFDRHPKEVEAEYLAEKGYLEGRETQGPTDDGDLILC